MKKFLFIISIVFTILTVTANEDDFIKSLKNCTPYSQTGTVTTEGMDVTSKKQILGHQVDKCVYKETVNFGGANTSFTCKFSKAQINEITSVMNAYSLVQQYSGEKVDTSSISNVQNNPVVKVWNKYLQDPSVCAIEGIK